MGPSSKLARVARHGVGAAGRMGRHGRYGLVAPKPELTMPGALGRPAIWRLLHIRRAKLVAALVQPWQNFPSSPCATGALGCRRINN
ncbi:hypothetical protein SBBP2_460012 [Burkholderiales bacterium]|nr:hypothetical protein SBBP2_460012 [Burkholderiales bacterium]